MMYFVVLKWTQVVYQICLLNALRPQARGQRVDISGRPRVHMLQLLFDTLKLYLAKPLKLSNQSFSAYEVTGN